jgi:hypothetical protein
MRPELHIALTAAQTLAPGELPRLLGELEEIRATALARLAAPLPQLQSHDMLLDVEQAASRLGVSRDYLYRNHAKFTFTRRIGKRLLFSSLGIDRHINQCRQ